MRLWMMSALWAEEQSSYVFELRRLEGGCYLMFTSRQQ